MDIIKIIMSIEPRLIMDVRLMRLSTLSLLSAPIVLLTRVLTADDKALVGSVMMV